MTTPYKTLTIHRYDGTQQTWEELYPKTIMSQVVDLELTLAGKQTKLTLDDGENTAIGGTVDVSPTSASTNLVSSGGVYTAINNVAAVANGRTKTYVTKLYKGGTTQVPIYYLLAGNAEKSGTITNSTSGVTAIQIYPNNDFSTTTDDYVQLKDGSNNVLDYLYLLSETGGVFTVEESVQISKMNVGDILLITNVDFPDFWLQAKSTSTFSKLETSKIVLDSYSTLANTVKSLQYSSGKIQYKLGNSNSWTDLVTAKIDDGVITIGGTSITPLITHQYREIKVNDTTAIGSGIDTALKFIDSQTSIGFSYDSYGLKSCVMSQASPTGTPRNGEMAFIIPAPNS